MLFYGRKVRYQKQVAIEFPELADYTKSGPWFSPIKSISQVEILNSTYRLFEVASVQLSQ